MKAMARKAANIPVTVLCFVQAATAALNSDENDQDSDACGPAGKVTLHSSPRGDSGGQQQPTGDPIGLDRGVQQCHFEALSKASGVACGLFLCT